MTMEAGFKITGFIQQNDGQPSGWSLKIYRQDDSVVFGLYWTDKEQATHAVADGLEHFKALVAAL